MVLFLELPIRKMPKVRKPERKKQKHGLKYFSDIFLIRTLIIAMELHNLEPITCFEGDGLNNIFVYG